MICVYLADGFEEVEAMTVVDLLRRADIDAVTVSIMKKKEVVGAHDVTVLADMLFEDVNHDNCEMMVLPGGGGGAERLDNHEGVVANLNEFDSNKKWIAAICAAPMVLGHNGIFHGQNATIYKGMEAELIGANYSDEKVVIDGHIITSQGPATAMDFALKIIEVIKNKAEAIDISKALLKDK